MGGFGWPWLIAVGAVMALARLAFDGMPVLLGTSAWCVACAAVIATGARRMQGRSRLAWRLFALSVLAGSIATALQDPVGGMDLLGARALFGLTAYGVGLLGAVIFIREFGGADPDAWIDALGMGATASLVVYELVVAPGSGSARPGGPGSVPLLVVAIDAAVFTGLARFVIRPIGGQRSLAGIGIVLASVIILDAVFYTATSIGLERQHIEAAWALGYGAWAAGAVHPDTRLLLAASDRQPPGMEDEIRSVYTAVLVHGVGLAIGLILLSTHLVLRGVAGSEVFVAVFALQLVLTALRSLRVGRRLSVRLRERRVTEAALRHSEERFRSLAEAAPVGIFIADPAGRSVFQNDAWSRAAGIPAASGLDRGYATTIHPDDAPWALGAWAESLRTHVPMAIEHRFLRPDGTTRWVQAHATPLRDPGGSVSGWVGTVTDITDLVVARMEALERESFAAALIAQSPVGIGVFDADGRPIGMNDAFTTLRRHVLQDDWFEPTDIRVDPLVVRLGQVEAVQCAYRGEPVAPDPNPVPVEVDAAGDVGVWVRMTWFPLRDPDGGVRAVIAFGEDVSEAARAETDRIRVEAKLRETAKLEALGVLAGGIAHDFNNLLVGILGHASLARSGVEPGTEIDADLEAVETSARRAADLARQMLAYSGRASFLIGPLHLGDLIAEMADLLKRSVSKSARLRTTLTPDLPPVVADATQLRQVALNLIVNASDALGGRPGIISIRTGWADVESGDPDLVPGSEVETGRYVMFEVSDTGVGMDDATLARIFEPFFSTKSTGRGLGLAAAIGIVKGHAGAIRVRSTPGEGTTFQVLLRPAEGGVAEPAIASRVVGATAPGVGRILVVDDEGTVRRVARVMLERAGYTVVEAVDGPEGVAAFAAEPDAWSGVLLDLTLPTLDGSVVLERIHAIRPDVRVVISSGWAQEEVVARVGELQGTVFLPKPYASAALLAAFAEP